MFVIKQDYEFIIKSIIDEDSITNPANPLNGKIVNDAFGGCLKFDKKIGEWKYEDSEQKQEKDRIIVLVLESPHKDEFDSNGNEIKPFFHREKIENNANKIFGKILKNSHNNEYCLYFMNAIQLQCSLGFDTELFRDYVFLYYWNNKKEDFERRLNDFISNEKNVSYVINVVTKGSHSKYPYLFNKTTQSLEYTFKKVGKKFLKKFCDNGDNSIKSLQDIVDVSISKIINKNEQIAHKRGTHPSGWYSDKAKIY